MIGNSVKWKRRRRRGAAWMGRYSSCPSRRKRPMGPHYTVLRASGTCGIRATLHVSMPSDSYTALPVYLTDEVRRIEALASQDADPPLMQRAGRAAAELARELIADSRRPILVFAGPGNNGGDAFVVATHLMQWWHRVSVVFAGDPEHLSADARAAFDAWRKASGEILSAPPSPTPELALVVDGLFGIGLQRTLDGQYAQWVDYMNEQSGPVL